MPLVLPGVIQQDIEFTIGSAGDYSNVKLAFDELKGYKIIGDLTFNLNHLEIHQFAFDIDFSQCDWNTLIFKSDSDTLKAHVELYPSTKKTLSHNNTIFNNIEFNLAPLTEYTERLFSVTNAKLVEFTDCDIIGTNDYEFSQFIYAERCNVNITNVNCEDVMIGFWLHDCKNVTTNYSFNPKPVLSLSKTGVVGTYGMILDETTSTITDSQFHNCFVALRNDASHVTIDNNSEFYRNTYGIFSRNISNSTISESTKIHDNTYGIFLQHNTILNSITGTGTPVTNSIYNNTWGVLLSRNCYAYVQNRVNNNTSNSNQTSGSITSNGYILL